MRYDSSDEEEASRSPVARKLSQSVVLPPLKKQGNGEESDVSTPKDIFAYMETEETNK